MAASAVVAFADPSAGPSVAAAAAEVVVSETDCLACSVLAAVASHIDFAAFQTGLAAVDFSAFQTGFAACQLAVDSAACRTAVDSAACQTAVDFAACRTDSAALP